MFNFFGFLFSLLKGIYNTCAIHTQLNKQASVACIFFAGFFEMFSNSINKNLLDSQISEHNKKLANTLIAYYTSQDETSPTPTAPQLHNLYNNHPFSLAPRNY